MSSKPAPMPGDGIDYGFPPGDEHLTFEEFVQEGEDDIAAGRTVTHQEVVKWFEDKYGRHRKA